MPFRRLALVLGDSLFDDHSALAPDAGTLFFMAEDDGLCTHFRYHKHKLVLFLSAMRSHADALRAKGYALAYHALPAEGEDLPYEAKLDETLAAHPSIDTLTTYEIEDHFFERRILDYCSHKGLSLALVDSPKFIFPRRDFDQYLSQTKKPFLHYYYIRQRKALRVLVDDQQAPWHGAWSFDQENRQRLPKGHVEPTHPEPAWTAHTHDVLGLVDTRFPGHPGDTAGFRWATTSAQVDELVQGFLSERFDRFGPYEDAFEPDQPFLYHSVLSPYLNMGLLRPADLLERVLAENERRELPFPSLEGFVRQIIGWREFLRGMYHTHELQKNFFGHRRRLTEAWYQGTTGIPPLDDTIGKARRYAYVHHIERLMVAGNLMLMCEIHPDDVYRWFMELFIDSADWVMAPNVYGMSQFADGGSFATKPYIAGSNYIAKMSHYPKKGGWTEVMDGLYWRFIDQNRGLFAQNNRMSMMAKTFDKMKEDRKRKILSAAESFLARHTVLED
jgi:deoxyribodipyrimidine photolyase-related protein